MESTPAMATRLRCSNPDCHLSFDESLADESERCPSCGSESKPTTVSRSESGAAFDPTNPEGPLSYHTRKSPWDIPTDTVLVGRFRIVRKLGEGGMGAVYLAEDDRLKRKVALKLPHPHLYEENPLFLERLYREAQIAARFHHPKICPIHDVGQSSGRHFIVMHYVEGETLSATLSIRAFEPTNAVRLIRSVAETLQEAHDRNIIHRDLKPSNLMINPQGDVIIMDFGLAKRTDDDPDDSLKTRDGTFVGTLAYAPPEQVEGRMQELGPGSDIYSLGVILYQLLAGRLPYQGSRYALMRRIVTSEPEPPSKHAPEVHADLDAIVLKAIAKQSRDRYASMSQFAMALTGYLAARPLPSPDRPPSMPASMTPSSPITRVETEQRSEASADVFLEDNSSVLITETSAMSSLFLEADSSPPAERVVRPTGVELIRIRPGTFLMGSLAGDDDEKPRHKVSLTRGFLLGKYPVTQREYEQISGRSPSFFKGEPGKPVEQVSWLDAIIFCNLMSVREGLVPFYSIGDGEVAVPDWRSSAYRLPTEAEWEYACQAGRTSAYGFGGDSSKLNGYAWHTGNSGGQTHKVGLKRPNAWGLHDMHGNVWEWCWDRYEPRYYQRGDCIDPRGPDTARKFRSLRGGHWGDKAKDLRSANRNWFEPSVRVRFIGFRLARSAE